VLELELVVVLLSLLQAAPMTASAATSPTAQSRRVLCMTRNLRRAGYPSTGGG
jgi:hypothetical protein